MSLHYYKTLFYRDHGREMAFAEKSGYKPAVNIEYVDNMGRLLTPKEVSCTCRHTWVHVALYCCSLV